MASLRRTKNFANDGQTPIFLYTILKQLDLRSIDWAKVAESLDISNGHAARMRYSRMRSQFEGMSNAAKPPKPKKEGDGKAAKEKAARGKRALLDEENVRLAGHQHSTGIANTLVADPVHKRGRYEAGSYSSTWMNPGTLPSQTANPLWNTPVVKVEQSANLGDQTGRDSHTAVVKQEAGDFPHRSALLLPSSTSPHPVIKQEPLIKDEPSVDKTGLDLPAAVPMIKTEAASTVADDIPTLSTDVTTAVYPGQYNYFGPGSGYMVPSQVPTYASPHGGWTGAATAYYRPPYAPAAFHYGGSAPTGLYPRASAPAPTWPPAVFGAPTDAPRPGPVPSLTLHPQARSFEEMLTLPLYAAGVPQSDSLNLMTNDPGMDTSMNMPTPNPRVTPTPCTPPMLHADAGNRAIPPSGDDTGLFGCLTAGTAFSTFAGNDNVPASGPSAATGEGSVVGGHAQVPLSMDVADEDCAGEAEAEFERLDDRSIALGIDELVEGEKEPATVQDLSAQG